MTISFNSPWECRIGLTALRPRRLRLTAFYFQFPVGMSNRSYIHWCAEANGYVCDFQFPVGMSNRSYFFAVSSPHVSVIPSFNSPWECRIGLTKIILIFNSGRRKDFQFPVGMSNRSYRIGSYTFRFPFIYFFQFPVGMSNRSYLV